MDKFKSHGQHRKCRKTMLSLKIKCRHYELLFIILIKSELIVANTKDGNGVIKHVRLDLEIMLNNVLNQYKITTHISQERNDDN